jgi:hypothetical protein
MIEYTVKVFPDGTKVWWLNDKQHREDGPAYEYANGTKSWFLYGLLHREDGPAIEFADGSKEWWVNGQQLTEQEFNARKVKELTVAEIEKLLGQKVKIVKG